MSPQELQVQKKRELEGKEESTIPARTFMPTRTSTRIEIL
jgi:hypothetical protein